MEWNMVTKAVLMGPPIKSIHIMKNSLLTVEKVFEKTDEDKELHQHCIIFSDIYIF